MGWRIYSLYVAIGVVLAVLVGVLMGLPILQMNDWRPATIVLTIFGLLLFYVISPLLDGTSRAEPTIIAALGMLALISSFVGMIINTQALFLSLAVNLIALWSLVIYYSVRSPRHRHIHQ